MSTELAANRTLVALAPGEVPAVQAELMDWCTQKMRALGQEYTELLTNLKLARHAKWHSAGVRNAVTRTKKRIQYYQKIRAAVRAGFLVVPNFPIEIFAVRVESQGPKAIEASPGDASVAHAEVLPVGSGRYVDDAQLTYDNSREEKRPDGTKYTVRRAIPYAYSDDIDFPLIAMKPAVVDATQRAMAKRIFDRIGIVNGRTDGRGRRGDPIVVGQIIDPRSTRWNDRRVTFFIAWWLDTKDL